MYAIDVGNWHSVLGMRPLLKGDRKGSPIGTNLSGPRPTPRLTARVNPTLRRISPPSSWRRSAGLAPVLGWCGQPSLNPEVGAHGRPKGPNPASQPLPPLRLRSRFRGVII